MLFTHWTNDPRWRPDPARRYVRFDAHGPSERPECHGAKPKGLRLFVDDGGRGGRWWASSEMPGKLGSAAIKVEADISRLLVLEDGEAWGIVESLLSELRGAPGRGALRVAAPGRNEGRPMVHPRYVPGAGGMVPVGDLPRIFRGKRISVPTSRVALGLPYD